MRGFDLHRSAEIEVEIVAETEVAIVAEPEVAEPEAEHPEAEHPEEKRKRGEKKKIGGAPRRGDYNYKTHDYSKYTT